MSPRCAFILALAGTAATGAAGLNNAADPRSAKPHTHHAAGTLSTGLLDSALEQRTRPSGETAVLLRSESLPEPTAGIGDLYGQLEKTVAARGLHGVALQVFRASFFGVIALVFVFVVHFSTHQLSKVRSPNPPSSASNGPPLAAPNKARPPTTFANKVSAFLASLRPDLRAKAPVGGRPDAKGKGKGKGKGKSVAETVADKPPSKAYFAPTGSAPKTPAIGPLAQAAPPKAPGTGMVPKAPAAARVPTTMSCYPWQTLPTPELLLAVGPTFHVNLKNILPDLLQTRGLQPAGNGNVAMIALWNWPGERQRALVELCVRDTLANKRAFAVHLSRSKLTNIAPPTFLSPAELRRALSPQQSKAGCLKRADPVHRQLVPAISQETKEGLWFLKHAGKDNNLGVTCYRGVAELMKHWINDVPVEERLHYVAQSEVPRPLLSTGFGAPADAAACKVTLRAYVLVLGTRCFLHREMLVKTHGTPYDPKDPDPLQHVLCHVKYEGVAASRATEWSDYAAVWPKIGEMMALCFSSFDYEALQDEAIYGEDDLWPWQILCKRLWSWLLRFMACMPLLHRLVKPSRLQLDEAESMKYALLGLDVIVDEDLRPWCLELNRSPTLNNEPRDPVGSQLKAEVVEDFCELLIDPLLNAAALASRGKPPRSAWGQLQHWVAERTPRRQYEAHRGFMELPCPRGQRSPCAVGATLTAALHKEQASADATEK